MVVPDASTLLSPKIFGVVKLKGEYSFNDVIFLLLRIVLVLVLILSLGFKIGDDLYWIGLLCDKL